MTADRPPTYTPKTASLPGKDAASRMVPMPVARRRFRTTVATAITGTSRRDVRLPWCPVWLAAAAIAGGTGDAADAVPPPSTAGRLLAAGEEAAERGWLVTARDHWMAAADAAARAGDSAARALAVARMNTLDAVAREPPPDRLRTGHRGDAAWSTADWRPSWRVAVAGRSTAAGPPTVGGGLVVWSTAHAVHAVSLADGGPAWPAGAPADTLVFPRGGPPFAEIGRGPDASAGEPLPVVLSTARRGFAVLDLGRDGTRLVCLDLTDRAQGRLAWSTSAADVPNLPSHSPSRGTSRSPATFVGPPAVDDEICAVVLRTDDGRGGLTLAVFDARDGSLRWSHDLGPSAAEDDTRGPRRCRRPCLAEDRIVVDTLAGTLRGFDRDGAAIWTLKTPPLAADGEPSAGGPPAVFAAGRLMIRAADGSAITAIEPRHGSPIWTWQADDARVEAVLGACDSGLVIATGRGDDGPGASTLLRLACDDGRRTAAWTVDGTAVGGGTLADGTVYWPVGRRSPSGHDTLHVELLDAGTLERRRPPIDCGPTTLVHRGTSPHAHVMPPVRLAVADDGLLLADDAITCLRPASDRSPDAPSR